MAATLSGPGIVVAAKGGITPVWSVAVPGQDRGTLPWTAQESHTAPCGCVHLGKGGSTLPQSETKG